MRRQFLKLFCKVSLSILIIIISTQFVAAQTATEKIFKLGYYSDSQNGPTLYIPVSAIRQVVVKEG